MAAIVPVTVGINDAMRLQSTGGQLALGLQVSITIPVRELIEALWAHKTECETEPQRSGAQAQAKKPVPGPEATPSRPKLSGAKAKASAKKPVPGPQTTPSSGGVAVVGPSPGSAAQELAVVHDGTREASSSGDAQALAAPPGGAPPDAGVTFGTEIGELCRESNQAYEGRTRWTPDSCEGAWVLRDASCLINFQPQPVEPPQFGYWGARASGAKASTAQPPSSSSPAPAAPEAAPASPQHLAVLHKLTNTPVAPSPQPRRPLPPAPSGAPPKPPAEAEWPPPACAAGHSPAPFGSRVTDRELAECPQQ